MEALRGQLDTIASTAGASLDRTTLAGSSALTTLQTQHVGYAQSTQQVSLTPVQPTPLPLHWQIGPRPCPSHPYMSYECLKTFRE